MEGIGEEKFIATAAPPSYAAVIGNYTWIHGSKCKKHLVALKSSHLFLFFQGHQSFPETYHSHPCKLIILFLSTRLAKNRGTLFTFESICLVAEKYQPFPHLCHHLMQLQIIFFFPLSTMESPTRFPLVFSGRGGPFFLASSPLGAVPKA